MTTKIVILIVLAFIALISIVYRKLFKYIEPLWLGSDNKISLRSSAAIGLTIDFVNNLSFAVHRWEAGRDLNGLANLLILEAGLIAAMLGLSTFQNTKAIEASNPNITVEKGGSVTKADTVNAEKVETINTNTTNVGKKEEAEDI